MRWWNWHFNLISIDCRQLLPSWSQVRFKGHQGRPCYLPSLAISITRPTTTLMIHLIRAISSNFTLSLSMIWSYINVSKHIGQTRWAWHIVFCNYTTQKQAHSKTYFKRILEVQPLCQKVLVDESHQQPKQNRKRKFKQHVVEADSRTGLS